MSALPESPGLRNMFGRLVPCPHCEGSGCAPCGYTGFPAGRIPPSVQAQLAAAGIDTTQQADDLRRHPANQDGAS